MVALTKSHLNLAAVRSDWERETIAVLEDLDCVEAFAPNDRGIGFVVPYTYNDTSALYEPDFIVHLRRGDGSVLNLVLEVKGMTDNRDRAKEAGAHRWVDAVNNWGKLGRWDYAVVADLTHIERLLADRAAISGP